MRKLAKRVFSFGMIFMTLFSYVCFPIAVNAATVKAPETLGDLKNQLADLKRQKAENERMEQQAKEQIKQKEAAIRQANADITQAEADIAEAQSNIEDSNQKISEYKGATESAMKALQQMKSKNAYMEYLADSASITEFIMRIKAMEQITNSYQEKLQELEKLIQKNEQLKLDLKKKQDELAKKIPVFEAAVKELYGNLEEYDEFALDIDTQIKTMQQQVNTYVELCKNSSKSYLGDAELLTDCSATPYNAGWLKPLNKGVVTSPWGNRLDPIAYIYKDHSGIDIGGNAEGTPIYAAAGGTVAGIINRYSCGGNMLFINVVVGGQKYTTYYYHLLSINVKVGQVVTQNSVIGYVGGYSTSTRHGGYDACSTGAHLHFGVMTGFYTSGTPKSRQISPPGFNNKVGYRFTSRTDYYG